MPRRITGLTLAALIKDRKGRRSFDRLSADCGGYPNGRRIQQMATATRKMKAFPDPETMVNLARGLNCTPMDVLIAAANSLHFPTRDTAGPGLTIPGGESLPPIARDALQYVGRAMVAMTNPDVEAAPVELQLPQSAYDLAAFRPADPTDGAYEDDDDEGYTLTH
jgi:hypothetical protein